MKSRMKNGKVCIALLLAFLMVLSLTGCAGSSDESNTEISESVSGVETADDTAVDFNDEEVEDEITPEVTAIPETSVPEDQKEDLVSSDDVEDILESDEWDNGLDINNDSTADESAETVDESVAGEDIAGKTDSALNAVEDEMPVIDEEDDGLSPTMRNSINMLNYMTSLTQSVNEEKGNQLFLELAYNSFDNLFPNSVDTKTQAQITSLMDTIQNYRMISVKRDRLQYIYEQNRAQALRQAIPNPLGLLSAVQSGSLLKAAASVLYMAVDSYSSYSSATSQADLQFLKDGWELDDAESAELHNSTKNALTYMLNMVRDYDIPGDYALSRGSVEDFVEWSSKPDSQLERKISWLETHQNVYSEFGPYWLELAKDYYNYEDYEKCLEAVEHYESISTRIFRKDIDYATVLPMAIISAKETMGRDAYVELASRYCQSIQDNTGDEDWTLRYFTAQIYMDLYSITKQSTYIDEAYKIVRENVVVLVDEQRSLNAAYLAPIEEVKVTKNATKREKQEIKNYNKLIKEERKIALPPVSEALYLNCDLLFALAEERGIDSAEQKRLENILHENGESIFLTKTLDDRFWFSNASEALDPDKISVTFDGDKLTIPAAYITDRSTIVVTVTGSAGTTTLDDWIVTDVKRPKNSDNCAEFTVTYESATGDKYKYTAGETITIKVTPVEESPDVHIDIKYNVVAVKKVVVFNGIKFERASK